ncbi:MAG: hypothetical protein MUP55_03190, partial [Candidatus Aenigmarchaeota archaeon]|nr:hypothetical protein [Candidatus Aenigmarchaeota archaeon]
MNKIGMKGQALIIAAIFIVLILIVLWSVVNIPAIKTGQIQSDVEVHSQIHIMGNALDAAKLYMETALAYSTYQACYDNLKSVGDSYPDEKTFVENLQASIKNNLGLYTGSKAYTFLS